MALTAGSRLGPYEIVSALGAGGMGEVYRARDTSLNRDVAIKVLPESFASDPERLARFQREAQVLASLNHPHIAHIHGLEQSGGVRALVMELVEGEDLAQRISRGPIPLDEALPIARQIAEALEAAHEQGIVHRDLKPANIKVRSDGTVKVLDFGLAKAIEPPPGSSASMSMSPTITSPAMMTGAGMILGTAAYMAPEQAKGRAADKRSDVWAFGCVLYEMLTARRAFEGDDVAEVMASVIRSEPDWKALPAAAPLAVRRLLRRCLQKDRARRLADIADARIEIDEARDTPNDTPVSALGTSAGRRPRLAWAIAAAAAMVAAGVTFRHVTQPVLELPASVRFSISAPSGTRFGSDSMAAISPDGRQVAFTVTLRDGGRRLAVRALDADDPRELAGTDGASGAFWSPDSRFLGFFADGKLKTIDVIGGSPRVICDVASGRAGSWSVDGTILFTTITGGGLSRVAAAGGVPVPATHLDESKQQFAHQSPWFLPDGRHFLFTAPVPESDVSTAFVGSLDDADVRAVAEGVESKAIYASGYLLYLRQGSLLAQPFDTGTLASTGEPQVVAGSSSSRTGPFSASMSGVLAYRAGDLTSPTQLALVDRSGTTLETIGDASDQTDVELSPGGDRVAISVLDASKRTRDIWIHDLRRNIRTRFTFGDGNDWHAVWSPDGTQIVFGSVKAGNGVLDLYQRAANGAGAEEPLVQGPFMKYVSSWSADGASIVYHNGSTGSPTLNDIWVVPMAGKPEPRAVLKAPYGESEGRLSPNGRWIAYRSSEAGRNEVYVAPFPGPGGKWQVSTGTGTQPRWRRDGRELYYVAGGNTLMSVAINPQPAVIEIGAVQRLFEAELRTDVYGGLGTGWVYDVMADGQRFLINRIVQDARVEPPIRIVTNWTSSIGR